MASPATEKFDPTFSEQQATDRQQQALAEAQRYVEARAVDVDLGEIRPPQSCCDGTAGEVNRGGCGC